MTIFQRLTTLEAMIASMKEQLGSSATTPAAPADLTALTDRVAAIETTLGTVTAEIGTDVAVGAQEGGSGSSGIDAAATTANVQGEATNHGPIDAAAVS